MEKKSKYSWALVGIRCPGEEKPDEQEVQKMLEESFLPGKLFQLFLCGAEVDKSGTLEEMEDGLDLIIEKMTDYHEDDYGIISLHEKGSLLFLPIIEKD